MDHGLSQNYSAYNNTFDVFSNGVNTRSSNCDIPETVFMAFPQQRSPQQCQQQLQQQAHQHYQHNQQHLQQNLLQQQSNQQHQFSPPTHQHLTYEQQKLQQQLQQLCLPQQNSQQQALNGHQIQQQQQQQHYQQQQDQLHNGSQQQVQMNQQYSNHHNPQHLQQNHQALNNHQQQHVLSHGQTNPDITQNYPVATMSSAYNTFSPSTSTSSSALNYSSPLPDGASLLNPTHVMFQPKPEPPSYSMMTENHLTFAQLAAGHDQDGSSFRNAQANQANSTPMDNYSQNNYSSPTYTQSYRDNYESGSPESVNSSSPPAGLITGEYVDNSPSMGMYSSSPSPPRASYGYGSPQNAFVPSSAAAGMVSENYVYPPTDCPPYTIPQIKTENASPCSTPTPHQTHIDTHPYARPSPGSSPRVCRRMPIDSNASSPKSGGAQSGSPTSSRRAHVLPPCKVCGVQATGFHYGVNTCEACKGFFRRSIIRKEEYTCLKSSKCIIEPGKRNLCGYCRYQKCIEAGMSVEGIKTGRYTYQKRTKDILELQQLKKELSQVRNQETKRIKELQTNDLIARVTEVAKNHPDIINLHDALRMQQKYLEEKQMLTDLFGKMERVNVEDYVYALENLGLELDDRREITNQLIEEMNSRMPLLYAVMKDLPGMDQISYNDTINLFKYSYIDIWLVARARMFNLSEGVFTTPAGTSFDFVTIFGQNAAETVQRLTGRLSTYSYTVEEKILLVGVVYLSTDRVFLQLEDRETIDRVREMYIEALEIHLPGNHPDVDHMFAKTLQIIADLRTVTQAVYNGLRGLLKYTNAKKYPLVHDILTVR